MLRLLIFMVVCCTTATPSSFAKCTNPVLNSAGTTVYALAYPCNQLKDSFTISVYRSHFPENDLFPDPALRRKAKWAKWLGIGSLLGLIIPGVNLFSLPAAITSLILGGQVRRQTIKPQYLDDVAKGSLASTVTIVFLAAITFISLLVISLGKGIR